MVEKIRIIQKDINDFQMFIGDKEFPIGNCSNVKLSLNVDPLCLPEIILTLPAIDFDIELLHGVVLVSQEYTENDDKTQ